MIALVFLSLMSATSERHLCRSHGAAMAYPNSLIMASLQLEPIWQIKFRLQC